VGVAPWGPLGPGRAGRATAVPRRGALCCLEKMPRIVRSKTGFCLRRPRFRPLNCRVFPPHEIWPLPVELVSTSRLGSSLFSWWFTRVSFIDGECTIGSRQVRTPLSQSRWMAFTIRCSHAGAFFFLVAFWSAHPQRGDYSSGPSSGRGPTRRTATADRKIFTG
jgi:hypothetical protein